MHLARVPPETKRDRPHPAIAVAGVQTASEAAKNEGDPTPSSGEPRAPIVIPTLGALVALSAVGAINDARVTASALKTKYEGWEARERWVKPFGGPATESPWALISITAARYPA